MFPPYYISKWECPRVYMLGHADVTCRLGTQPWKIACRKTRFKERQVMLSVQERASATFRFAVESIFNMDLLAFKAAAQSSASQKEKPTQTRTSASRSGLGRRGEGREAPHRAGHCVPAPGHGERSTSTEGIPNQSKLVKRGARLGS